MMKVVFILAMGFLFSCSGNSVKREPQQLTVDYKKAKSFNNVVICAVECNSEILGHMGHDLAHVGKLYFANANNTDNVAAPGVCISNAQEVELYSNRLSDDTSAQCSDILNDKYRGKVVDLQIGWQSEPKPNDDMTRYLKIKVKK